jgi:ribosomal protein S18 acetylase RimI-like enzyme
MNEIVYRTGSITDLPQLMDLAQISYGQYDTVLTPDNFATLNKFLHNEAAFTEMVTQSHPFVATDQESIVGMAFLVTSGHPTDIYDAAWCYIRMVGVHPSVTGRGVAKKLTELCIEKAKALGEQTIALHTSEFMDAARHIYEKAGFTVLREIEPRFGKRYWLYSRAVG